MTEAETPTMRARYRAQVRQEVKEAALAQLAAAGPAGLSVTAIGKQLGVSGPALYRYFASRDELLTELVADAYDDLAGACAAAEAGGGPAGRGRWLSRTGTGCCSGRRCRATTRTSGTWWTRPRPP